MDKKRITLFISCLIVVLLGITSFFLLKPKTYKEITFDEYRELFESDDAFVLFAGTASCSYCTIYKKTINRIVKDYGITVNYIDLETLTIEQRANINSHFPVGATPTTFIIKNGEEIGVINGNKSYSESVKIFKKTKIIKK